MRTKINFLFFLALSAKVLAQPANNACASAINLVVNDPCTNGTNVGATTQLGENTAAECLASAMDKTVWYKFTTTSAGIYNVSTDIVGAPDTQIKVYTNTCPGSVATEVACNEDGGTNSALASVASFTATATTTYLVQVDNFGTGAGVPFCIGVSFVQPPANDCVLSATDITTQINGLSSSNLFDCTSNTFNAVGPGGEPTEDVLAGDANQCNGADILTNPIPEHYDVWFKFTVTGSTPSAWLSAYQNSATTPSYSIALYSGTPAGTCGPSGSITGLTYVDCSTGDYIEVLPTDNTQGGALDMGICTTPIVPKIDISSLPNGTYYLRVWETFGYSPPTDGEFNLCAESGTPAGVTADKCPGNFTVGCIGNQTNTDLSATYTDLGNNGMTGNSCNTDPNEPQLAVGAAGQIKDACVGPWVTNVGYANNVMNNSAIYQFKVDATPPCQANVVVTLDNIQFGGKDGNVAQVQVMNGACAGGSSAVMTGTTSNGCLQMRPVGSTLPSGTYYIIVDGQDGQLLQYDLNVSINHTGIGCSPIICGSFILGVGFDNFIVEQIEHHKNILKWETNYEKDNDYFVVERTYDGINYESVSRIEGNGTTNLLNKYQSEDDNFNINQELVYYRIKQVDLNGNYSYSDIKVVKLYQDKKVIKTINLMGQEVNENFNGFVIKISDDGTVTKSL